MRKRRKKISEDYEIRWKSRLKVYRAEKNLTHENIADELGVTRQTISSIEKGKYNPSLILAYKIAHMFNVTIEEIFKFESTKSS